MKNFYQVSICSFGWASQIFLLSSVFGFSGSIRVTLQITRENVLLICSSNSSYAVIFRVLSFPWYGGLRLHAFLYLFVEVSWVVSLASQPSLEHYETFFHIIDIFCILLAFRRLNSLTHKSGWAIFRVSHIYARARQYGRLAFVSRSLIGYSHWQDQWDLLPVS